MPTEYHYGSLTWPQVKEAVAARKVAVVPVAVLEDHGLHLPIDTDLLLCNAVCERAVAACADRAVLVPAINHGFTPHHMDFPGPITIGWQTFIAYGLDVCRSLAHHGFSRILIVNGHGSNTPFVDIIARLTVVETNALAAAVNYWNAPGVHEVAESLRESDKVGGMNHACEFETSIYLALRPDLVDMSKAARELSHRPTKNYWTDLVAGDGPLAMMEHWSAISDSGSHGRPHQSERAKRGAPARGGGQGDRRTRRRAARAPGREAKGPPLRTLLRFAFVVAAIALSACTKVSTQTGVSTGGNAWTHPGVLRIASRQEPDNLNPMLGTEVIDKDLSMFWGGYLFNWSDQNQLVPELAAQVPTLANGGISKDGLTITYHLRSGVKWQDGAPFSADDVIFTWQQQLNPDNPVISRLGFDDIARIDRRDDHTIAVHLKKRFSPFVNMFFAMSNNPVAVLPKHLLSQYHDLTRVAYNRLPVGTGPFRVVEYVRGSHIIFEANPLYWRGPPKLKRIEWQIVGNDNTILTLLESNQIDFYYRATEGLKPSLEHIPGTSIIIYPFTQYADIGINASHPPLDDLRVRHALAYATDRKELIDKVSHGVNALGDTDQPDFLWAHDDHAANLSIRSAQSCGPA